MRVLETQSSSELRRAHRLKENNKLWLKVMAVDNKLRALPPQHFTRYRKSVNSNRSQHFLRRDEKRHDFKKHSQNQKKHSNDIYQHNLKCKLLFMSHMWELINSIIIDNELIRKKSSDVNCRIEKRTSTQIIKHNNCKIQYKKKYKIDRNDMKRLKHKYYNLLCAYENYKNTTLMKSFN